MKRSSISILLFMLLVVGILLWLKGDLIQLHSSERNPEIFTPTPEAVSIHARINFSAVYSFEGDRVLVTDTAIVPEPMIGCPSTHTVKGKKYILEDTTCQIEVVGTLKP